MSAEEDLLLVTYISIHEVVAVRDVAPPIREDESEKCIKNAVSVFALYCCLW